MSGDGKRSVAEWPKLPRPSSTLPFRTWADVRPVSVMRSKPDVESGTYFAAALAGFGEDSVGASGFSSPIIVGSNSVAEPAVPSSPRAPRGDRCRVHRRSRGRRYCAGQLLHPAHSGGALALEENAVACTSWVERKTGGADARSAANRARFANENLAQVTPWAQAISSSRGASTQDRINHGGSGDFCRGSWLLPAARPRGSTW